MIWSGAEVDIPTGWHLCDGTNGTPDLRDRFIIGAGSTYAPGVTGGNSLHSHPFTSDGHYHDIPPGFGVASGTDVLNHTSEVQCTGTTDAGSSLPPFYSLCFIMYL